MAIPNLLAIKDWCLGKFAKTTDIPDRTSQLTNDSDFVTDEDLKEKGYLTEIPDNYVTDEKLEEKGYLTSVATMSENVLGIGKPDGTTITVDADGTMHSVGSGESGTTNYNALTNKPSIEGKTLSGNKTLEELGIQAVGDYATTEDLQEYALVDESGFSLVLTVDPQTYVMDIQLKNKGGAVISSQQFDFPIETAFVNVHYDKNTHEITFILQNGTQTDPIDISDIVRGLVPDDRTIAGLALKSDITAEQLKSALEITEMIGCTPMETGESGLVPKPTIGSTRKALLGNGTWGNPEKADTATNLDGEYGFQIGDSTQFTNEIKDNGMMFKFPLETLKEGGLALDSDVEELKKSVSDGKTLVAGAITAKGITTATDATFQEMADNIGEIETGGIPVLQEKTVTLDTKTTNVIVEPDDNYNGLSQVTANINTEKITLNSFGGNDSMITEPSEGKVISEVELKPIATQDKGVTLSTSPQIITADSGKVLGSVSVPGVPGNAALADVLSGKTFNSATAGISKTGTMANKGSTTQDATYSSDDSYIYLTIPSNGYYNTSSKLRAPNNIMAKLSETYSGVRGSFSAEVGHYYLVATARRANDGYNTADPSLTGCTILHSTIVENSGTNSNLKVMLAFVKATNSTISTDASGRPIVYLKIY